MQLLIDIQHLDGSWLKRECFDIDCTGNSANTGSDDDSLNSSVEKGWVTVGCQIALDSENAIAMWSDENPLLYRAVVQLKAGEQKLDQEEQRFGMRSFASKGKQLVLNGTPVFLRGYVDCCIFPLTGYPVWDSQYYVKQFRIAKSYGFNHVRLHGWSPPEPFWEAADEEGMLVQAELPHWSRFFEQRDMPAPVETKYLPVFWNYLMFATQPGATMGMYMEKETALLGAFPQDGASDWHWYHLVNGTPAICLDTMQGATPLIEVVDHFHRAKRLAYAFEARAGKGSILVSSFPFTDTALMKRPEAAFLFQEMLSYACGEQFHPESSVTAAELLGVFKLQPIQFTL